MADAVGPVLSPASRAGFISELLRQDTSRTYPILLRKNTPHPLIDLLRQSVYNRLAGF